MFWQNQRVFSWDFPEYVRQIGGCFLRISRFSRNAPIFAAHFRLLANIRGFSRICAANRWVVCRETPIYLPHIVDFWPKPKGGFPWEGSKPTSWDPPRTPKSAISGDLGPKMGSQDPPFWGFLGSFGPQKSSFFHFFGGFRAPKKVFSEGQGTPENIKNTRPRTRVFF